jgi:hypothetical protein
MRSCVCEQSTTCAATPLTSRAFSPATSSIGTTPPSSLPAMQLPLRRSRRYIVHTEAAVSSMSRHAHTCRASSYSPILALMTARYLLHTCPHHRTRAAHLYTCSHHHQVLTAHAAGAHVGRRTHTQGYMQLLWLPRPRRHVGGESLVSQIHARPTSDDKARSRLAPTPVIGFELAFGPGFGFGFRFRISVRAWVRVWIQVSD